MGICNGRYSGDMFIQRENETKMDVKIILNRMKVYKM
jgi:hypothetical protein